MKNIILSLTLVLGVSAAHASRVAVVDSGTDFGHQMLQGHDLVNTAEVVGNRVDDDRNGKADDIDGWNFVNNSNKFFTFEHLTSINPIVYPLITVLAHQQGGIATPAELQFYKDNVTSLTMEQKVALSAHVNYFGEYAHSTHVSGIIIQQNSNAKILSAKVFPDEPPPLYPTPAHQKMGGPVDWVYKYLAILENNSFAAVATYLNERQIDTANYSLGMSLATIAKLSLSIRGNKNPTDAQVAAETARLYAQFDVQGRAWMASSPGTLFVIAAGNDGTDNDVLPAFPGNVRVDNAICVAATQGYEKLAFFSNYGATMVDVAAPGVSIMSSVPSLDQTAMLPLSGTSMAAPFVTGVASRVKDANPALTPGQIRQILMGTVDHKDWLVGKVVSGGIVNPDRAAEAGRLSITMNLDAAMTAARTTVADMPADQNGPKFNAGAVPADLKDMAKQFVF